VQLVLDRRGQRTGCGRITLQTRSETTRCCMQLRVSRTNRAARFSRKHRSAGIPCQRQARAGDAGAATSLKRQAEAVSGAPRGPRPADPARLSPPDGSLHGLHRFPSEELGAALTSLGVSVPEGAREASNQVLLHEVNAPGRAL